MMMVGEQRHTCEYPVAWRVTWDNVTGHHAGRGRGGGGGLWSIGCTCQPFPVQCWVTFCLSPPWTIVDRPELRKYKQNKSQQAAWNLTMHSWPQCNLSTWSKQYWARHNNKHVGSFSAGGTWKALLWSQLGTDHHIKRSCLVGLWTRHVCNNSYQHQPWLCFPAI